MRLEENVAYVRSLFERHYPRAWTKGVAADFPGDLGIPLEMQATEIDDEGWVEWKMLDSPLGLEDVRKLEAEFGIEFPDPIRAYFLAACQLFSQTPSPKHNGVIILPEVPNDDPLKDIRETLTAWQPLINARYIPFAEWGDGFGPVCCDGHQGAGGDCPIVWMDHELLAGLENEAFGKRNLIESLAQPLYSSSREMFEDLFGTVS